jgi:hypothetical protein
VRTGTGLGGGQGASELKSIADETLTARTQMKMLSATVEDMRSWMSHMMDDTVHKVNNNLDSIALEMQVSGAGRTFIPPSIPYYHPSPRAAGNAPLLQMLVRMSFPC